MSTVQRNPYESPRSTLAPEISGKKNHWPVRTLGYISLITGIVSVVAYQFITDEPQTSPSGVVTVNAYLEVAALSAVLSAISAIALLRLRSNVRDSLKRWQSFGLGLLALVASVPALAASWYYLIPFFAHVSGVNRQ